MIAKIPTLTDSSLEVVDLTEGMFHNSLTPATSPDTATTAESSTSHQDTSLRLHEVLKLSRAQKPAQVQQLQTCLQTPSRSNAISSKPIKLQLSTGRKCRKEPNTVPMASSSPLEGQSFKSNQGNDRSPKEINPMRPQSRPNSAASQRTERSTKRPSSAASNILRSVSPSAFAKKEDTELKTFDEMHASLNRLVAKLGDMSLQEKWKRISRYLDDYVDVATSKDVGETLQGLLDGIMERTAKFAPASQPRLAFCLALFDQAMSCFVNFQPIFETFIMCVRQELQAAIFPQAPEFHESVMDVVCDAESIERAMGRYMLPTWMERAKEFLTSGQEVNMEIARVKEECEHWKGSYVSKVFSAWKSVVTSQKKVDREVQRIIAAQPFIDGEYHKQLVNDCRDLRDLVEKLKQDNLQMSKNCDNLKDELATIKGHYEQNLKDLNKARNSYVDLNNQIGAINPEDFQKVEKSKRELASILDSVVDELKGYATDNEYRESFNSLLKQDSSTPESCLINFFNTTLDKGNKHRTEHHLSGFKISGVDFVEPLFYFMQQLGPSVVTDDDVENFSEPYADKAELVFEILGRFRLVNVFITKQDFEREDEMDEFNVMYLLTAFYRRLTHIREAKLRGAPPLKCSLKSSEAVSWGINRPISDSKSWDRLSAAEWQKLLRRKWTEERVWNNQGEALQREIMALMFRRCSQYRAVPNTSKLGKRVSLTEYELGEPPSPSPSNTSFSLRRGMSMKRNESMSKMRSGSIVQNRRQSQGPNSKGRRSLRIKKEDIELRTR